SFDGGKVLFSAISTSMFFVPDIEPPIYVDEQIMFECINVYMIGRPKKTSNSLFSHGKRGLAIFPFFP
ncbi:MAG: hypothetical protein AAB301_00730, partial [Nitrospirota bacterium]